MKSALEQVKAAARGKDVRVSGGAQTIRQSLKAELIDEFTLHIAPGDLKAEQVEVIPSRLATHITYRIPR
jgi:dihydrofolate reductase